MFELAPGSIVRGASFKGYGQSCFKALSLLGQGNFSRVYLAEDPRGSLTALKQIRTDHLTEREYSQLNGQFLQEAALLMSLSHPGLPRVLDFFAQGPCYYLAMEWIPGKNLEEWITARGVPDESQVLQWGLELCDVLEYLHARTPYPVIMGDLKPANVVAHLDGSLRVVDFGVARHLCPSQHREIALVTPGFSPPEQHRQAKLDQRSDIYSLAATLYWVLSPCALERFNFEIPPIRRFRPEISQALTGLLQRCLASSPDERYRSASRVKEILSRIVDQWEETRRQASAQLSDLYRRKNDFRL